MTVWRNRLALTAVCWALGAGGAVAGPVTFEDQTTLGEGRWQLNTIATYLPTVERVQGASVRPLSADELAHVQQYAQEIRFGLSDTVMVRTTLPLNVATDGLGTGESGWGDWEAFLKGRVWGRPDGAQLALGLQVIGPTAGPAMFSMTGGMVVSPSVMANAPTPLGTMTAMAAWMAPLGQVRDGQAVRPGDSMVLGLSWDRNLAETLNVALEVQGARGMAGSTNGEPDGGPGFWSLSAGPGVTWAFLPGQELQAAVLLPVVRVGEMPGSQPFIGMLQLSLNM